jgi:hypothetical protein
VEKLSSLRLHLTELEPARLAAPAQAGEYEDALVAKLAALFCLDAQIVQTLAKPRPPSFKPANPLQLPGAGPSTITYSISGCAQSAELKSPRSQAA